MRGGVPAFDVEVRLGVQQGVAARNIVFPLSLLGRRLFSFLPPLSVV